MFEIVKRDGLARIGKFETRSGVLETPALLPVVNPKICTVTPKELYEEFGFKALITNSYIIKNTPDLKAKAQEVGLHKMLDFPGVIMTDSGTFQSHMYGEVEVTNEEMVEFQKSIGTDIGTVLDIFTEPYWTKEQTAESIEVTLERTQKACDMKGDMMINGVVQGSVYPDLREDCARKMAVMDVDVHPIGGVVPLMEQYRYLELVDVVMSSKKGLNPNRPVHLFGAGHPMVLALATLMGCDLFDSASYAKFARDDRMMFIDGTYRLQDMQSLDCNCPACRGLTLESLRKMGSKERMKVIARHNLYQITDELALVKRYVKEGRLWELAEMRCRAHPAMLDALRRLEEHQEFMERYDPISRDGAMFYTGSETRCRPVFRRYMSRIWDRYVPEMSKAALFYDEGSKPYSRALAADFDRVRRSGYTPVVVSPFGPVPAELDELYPIAQSLFPVIEDIETMLEAESSTVEFLEHKFSEVVKSQDVSDDGDQEYDADLIRAKAVSRYQFGIEATDALFKGKIELVVSRKTGKIRNVISDGEHVLSMRAGDGLYTLRKEGADRIVSAVPSPFMRVKVNDDAVPFVSEGRNAFCQFVTECDEGLKPMDEVIVTDKDDKVIATGRIMLVADEIRSFKKGIAVKVRSGSGDEA
ncbi:MAG: tRNA guanosine(15) transglycosylase TgtA [Candidatus Methanoplasma sp.]|jgi:7-cyano-7-deazaguanine tRNA-ribosyltransferase|nr:tRNA guanosine(15) transglycosylase TgtA [Candidatus Methanoplasma sp.]